MRVRIMAAVLAAVALTAVAPGQAAGTLGVLAGTGVSEFGECAPDSLQISIRGNEVVTGEWAFSAHAVNTDPGCELPAIGLLARGPWSSAGGCMPVEVMDAVIGDTMLCLENPRPNGPLVDYDMIVCPPDDCRRDDQVDFVTVAILEA